MNFIKLTTLGKYPVVINLDNVLDIHVSHDDKAHFHFINNESMTVDESFEDVISRLTFTDNKRAYLPDLKMEIDPQKYLPKL